MLQHTSHVAQPCFSLAQFMTTIVHKNPRNAWLGQPKALLAPHSVSYPLSLGSPEGEKNRLLSHHCSPAIGMQTSAALEVAHSDHHWWQGKTSSP